MKIPIHSSLYYAPSILKCEHNVERQLTYHLYYQCDSIVRLTKETQLEVFLLLQQPMYIFMVANQNILCDIFFIKIVLSCS